MTRPIQLIGIIPEERAKTGDFAEFLFDARAGRSPPSFDVPEAYKEQTTAGRDPPGSPARPEQRVRQDVAGGAEGGDGSAGPRPGVILGYALATYHRKGHDGHLHRPAGHQVGALFPRFGKTKSEAGFETATTIGYFKSGMSEYDSTHVYMPLEALQKARFLYDFDRKVGAVNQIQIKVRPGVNLGELCRRIQVALDKMRPMFYQVQTWEQKQGPLLARWPSSRAS